MYLFDLYTVSTNLAGIGGMSIPCGFSSAGAADRPALAGPAVSKKSDCCAARTCFSRRPIGTRGDRT